MHQGRLSELLNHVLMCHLSGLEDNIEPHLIKQQILPIPAEIVEWRVPESETSLWQQQPAAAQHASSIDAVIPLLPGEIKSEPSTKSEQSVQNSGQTAPASAKQQWPPTAPLDAKPMPEQWPPQKPSAQDELSRPLEDIVVSNQSDTLPAASHNSHGAGHSSSHGAGDGSIRNTVGGSTGHASAGAHGESSSFDGEARFHTGAGPSNTISEPDYTGSDVKPWEVSPAMAADSGVAVFELAEQSSVPEQISMGHKCGDTDHTGRLGEYRVWQWLSQLAQAGSLPFTQGSEETNWKVIWVNQQGESGKPFDLIVEDSNQAHSYRIEVKSTRTADVRNFEISTDELAESHGRGSNYIIARAFNVSSEPAATMRVMLMPNPWQLVQRGTINLLISF